MTDKIVPPIKRGTFKDPAIPRKRLITDKVQFFEGIPLPSMVEISESGTCNRLCSFCPRSDLSYPNVQEFIKPELIEKLSKQLAGKGFEGLFVFSGFVEPMLDKNVYSLIKIVRRELPACRIEMVTNGDALSSKNLRNLFASGLTTILISVYDGPGDAAKFEQLCIREGLTAEQFVIRHRYLPEEQSFGITLSNRAGMMSNAAYKIDSPIEPLREKCFYPAYTFFVDYLGDVLICGHDWGKKYIVGNMNNGDFWKIWTSERFMNARKKLLDGDRLISPCNKCDVQGGLMGGRHAEAWMGNL